MGCRREAVFGIVDGAAGTSCRTKIAPAKRRYKRYECKGNGKRDGRPCDGQPGIRPWPYSFRFRFGSSVSEPFGTGSPRYARTGTAATGSSRNETYYLAG